MPVEGGGVVRILSCAMCGCRPVLTCEQAIAPRFGKPGRGSTWGYRCKVCGLEVIPDQADGAKARAQAWNDVNLMLLEAKQNG